MRVLWASAVWRCLWQCKIPETKNSAQVLQGVLARKNSKNFPAETHWQGVTPNFSSPGPVASHQNLQIIAKNVQIPTKLYKFLKMARETTLQFLANSCWREKVNIFSRRGVLKNSRHAPNRPDLSGQMVAQEKNCGGLVDTVIKSKKSGWLMQLMQLKLRYVVALDKNRRLALSGWGKAVPG